MHLLVNTRHSKAAGKANKNEHGGFVCPESRHLPVNPMVYSVRWCVTLSQPRTCEITQGTKKQFNGAQSIIYISSLSSLSFWDCAHPYLLQLQLLSHNFYYNQIWHCLGTAAASLMLLYWDAKLLPTLSITQSAASKHEPMHRMFQLTSYGNTFTKEVAHLLVEVCEEPVSVDQKDG